MINVLGNIFSVFAIRCLYGKSQMRTGDHSREYATCQVMRAWCTSNYTRTTKDMDGRLKAVFLSLKPVGKQKWY